MIKIFNYEQQKQILLKLKDLNFDSSVIYFISNLIENNKNEININCQLKNDINSLYKFKEVLELRLNELLKEDKKEFIQIYDPKLTTIICYIPIEKKHILPIIIDKYKKRMYSNDRNLNDFALTIEVVKKEIDTYYLVDDEDDFIG